MHTYKYVENIYKPLCDEYKMHKRTSFYTRLRLQIDRFIKYT